MTPICFTSYFTFLCPLVSVIYCIHQQQHNEIYFNKQTFIDTLNEWLLLKQQ